LCATDRDRCRPALGGFAGDVGAAHVSGIGVCCCQAPGLASHSRPCLLDLVVQPRRVTRPVFLSAWLQARGRHASA
jgi:hypothetical protein